MTMQGRMEDMARARRHERAYAKMKPVMKAEMEKTQRATFSEIPC